MTPDGAKALPCHEQLDRLRNAVIALRAMARTVPMAALGCLMDDAAWKEHDLTSPVTPDPATQRVLEAAKRWHETPGRSIQFEFAVRDLFEAVEALAAREKIG